MVNLDRYLCVVIFLCRIQQKKKSYLYTVPFATLGIYIFLHCVQADTQLLKLEWVATNPLSAPYPAFQGFLEVMMHLLLLKLCHAHCSLLTLS